MYNIYCDESCHLQSDKSDIMVLGSLVCPSNKKEKIYNDIREIKKLNGVNTRLEVKWTKVSAGNLNLYKDLINYFFQNDYLSFRAIVATGKSKLDHYKYNDGDYDTWYYKMYYQMLYPLLNPESSYRIFIDIKDTRGGARIKELHRILGNKKNDKQNEILKDVKQIQSNESEILQVCDLIIGALSYFHRGYYYDESKSSSKRELLDEITKVYGIGMLNSTPFSESKFNIFIWKPRGTY
ncbi:DUF3800 domain-containing protein [Sutcliffiella horikoshii]|uniref:DUF3800 domain-containing protein n=1 Tax=Sutcliffiella horikoshii TaxID=79883 RepID=UPI0007D0738B|nr:DUF3800 domain-containing protein [Sutcliffiella horikoshii]MCM3620529.1 DUF3800 domain-containing protein [Sutcliffiella horikoshii]